MSEKAIEIPFEECAVTVSVGRDGVWLNFSSLRGTRASINAGSFANQYHNQGIIRSALLDWCDDRIKDAEQIKADNSQFGVGA